MTEPLVMTFRYEKALEAPVPKVEMNEDQIEIKMHAPLPYTSNWEETDPVQKCFKLGDEFYNVVERRYESDTLYFTLQRNLNARDKFDALSSILNALKTDSSKSNPKQAPRHAAAEDFMKVFSPALPPALVSGHFSSLEKDRRTSIWHYAFFLPAPPLPVVVPPPDYA